MYLVIVKKPNGRTQAVPAYNEFDMLEIQNDIFTHTGSTILDILIVGKQGKVN